MDRKTLIRFIVLGIVGYSLYVAIEILFRNESYRWSGIMGMVAILLLDGINDYISWDIPLVIQAGFGGCLITAIEYLVGLLDLYVLHIGMWDYSNIPFNFCGIICVPFTLAWCVLAVVGILVSDCLNYYMFHTNPRPYYLALDGHVLFMLPKRECD